MGGARCLPADWCLDELSHMAPVQHPRSIAPRQERSPCCGDQSGVFDSKRTKGFRLGDTERIDNKLNEIGWIPDGNRRMHSEGGIGEPVGWRRHLILEVDCRVGALGSLGPRGC